MEPKHLPNETQWFSWDGHVYSMCNTAKFPNGLNSQNQVFSLVETVLSISRSLHDFSKPDFYHTCPSQIYIYITHITFCGRIFNHTVLKVQYNKKRDTNSREQAELLELCDNSMSFTPFFPKPSPHALHTIWFPECNSLFPKSISNNRIVLFQNCDTVDRTT